MRTALMTLVACGWIILSATADQGDKQQKDAQTAKRLAEIEKEIKEIEKEIAERQARIARLSAEFAKIQPQSVVRKARLASARTFSGVIQDITGPREQPSGMRLENGSEFPLSSRERASIGLDRDTEFRFSDNQKARASDLRVGQTVTVTYQFVALAKSEPAVYSGHGYVVVIHKAR